MTPEAFPNPFSFKPTPEELGRCMRSLVALCVADFGEQAFVPVPPVMRRELEKEGVAFPSAVGAGNMENTSALLQHVAYCIGYAVSDERIQQWWEDHTDERQVVAECFEEQILRGVRILDVGSGPNAFFARFMRALGAEVYTADVVPLSADIADTENRHIQVDLNDSKAIEILQNKSEGAFDIVTAATVHHAHWNDASTDIPGAARIAQLASSLLKQNGLFLSELEAWIKS